MSFIRKPFYVFGLVMLLLFAGTPVLTASTAPPNEQIQLVTDQQFTVAGGIVSYHILYFSDDHSASFKSAIKVKIPEGMILYDPSYAVFDQKLNELTWYVNTPGAKVIHFKLKVKDNVQTGQTLQLQAQNIVNGELKGETKEVLVKIGTEIDQPVFNGYPDGNFHPERNVTRAETAAMIARVKDLNEQTAQNPFSDLMQDHWAYHYILQAYQAGYMLGEDGQFRPDDPITRGEFLVLLLRLREIEPIPLEDNFSDAKGNWAEGIIATAKALNFVDGLNSDFTPDQGIRRDAAAKLLAISLYRGQLIDGEMKVIQHWPDVPPANWAIGWVEEMSMVAHESKHTQAFEEKLIRYLPDQTKSF